MTDANGPTFRTVENQLCGEEINDFDSDFSAQYSSHNAVVFRNRQLYFLPHNGLENFICVPSRAPLLGSRLAHFIFFLTGSVALLEETVIWTLRDSAEGSIAILESICSLVNSKDSRSYPTPYCLNSEQN